MLAADIALGSNNIGSARWADCCCSCFLAPDSAADLDISLMDWSSVRRKESLVGQGTYACCTESQSLFGQICAHDVFAPLLLH
jgi:hypothetical protein